MEQKTHGLLYHIFDVVLNILIIVAVVAAIRTFLVSPFQVDGSSMESTLQDGEYIVINKLAYHLGEPERGDVAVLLPPTRDTKHYVKRIIGLPGDTIILQNGVVYVQTPGSSEPFELEEPYLNEQNAGRTFRHPQQAQNNERTEFEVPPGQYFVLGDNRRNSSDSRSFEARGAQSAFVPEDNVVGRVWFIALPITKAGVINPPEYAF